MKGRMEMDTNDAFEHLRAELAAVEPSPGFAAGVRTRVDARSGAGFRLRFALVTATVAIAAVAGGAYWLQRGSAVSPAAPIQAVAQSVPVPAVEPVVTPAPRVAARRTARVARPVAAAMAAAAPAGPSLDVITNQPEMIRRLRSRLQVEVKVELSHASEVIEIPEIATAPVEVKEIQVSVIGGVLPVVRSMK